MNRDYIAKLRQVADLMEELFVDNASIVREREWKAKKETNEQKAAKTITDNMIKVFTEGFNEEAYQKSKLKPVVDNYTELEMIRGKTPNYKEFVLKHTKPVTQESKTQESNPTKVAPNKGYKYPKGTHWTQKPENAALLKRTIKKMIKATKKK